MGLVLLGRYHLPYSVDATCFIGGGGGVLAPLGRGLVPVGDVLAFSAEALYVDADDGGAVEGLLDIYLP